MKKYFSIYLFLLVIFLVSVRVNVTEAKSVTYSPGKTVWASDSCNNAAITYSVQYKANVYNDSAGGVLLNDGDIIPTGTQIRFQDGPYVDSDINYFSMGLVDASPYGTWVAEAKRPSSDKFSTNGYNLYSSTMAALSVEPPLNISATHSGTAGLLCDASGMACTVTSPGSIQTQVVFNNRPLQKVYEYGGPCDLAFALLTADYQDPGEPSLALGKSINIYTNAEAAVTHRSPDCGYGVPCEYNYGSTDYLILANGDSANYATDTGIPSQTIPFTLTAVAAGNPPTPPTIVGPTTGITNTPYTFTLTGTDPDGDTIRYGIDWDSNGSVDQQIPSTGYVPSGTEQSVDHTWLSVGTYTFRALTEDVNSATSAWTTHTITIDTLPTCTSVPEHTVVCTGDEIDGFTGSIASTLQEFSTSCTLAQRCEYLCAQGYLYAGGTCDPTQCNDGIDNDTPPDGLTDLNDPGCENDITNNSEFNPPENPILTVDRRTVVKDGTVTLTWDTNNGNEALCTLTAYSGGQNLIIANGDGAGSVDVTIPARSTYTLSCPNPLGGAPLTDTVSIDIVPVGVET